MTEKEKDKFKFQLVYLIPILASLAFGLACAFVLAPQPLPPLPVTPFPNDTPSGPPANALYFVALIAISATLFYILIKKRSRRIITVLIVVALTTASLLLSLVYLAAIFTYFPPSYEILIFPLAIALTILFDLSIFRLGDKARNIAVICLGGALGILFGYSIPLFSAVLILAFLAVYDVIAVYRGPVGKIAESGLDQLKGLSYSFKDIQMGLGDLVFYSMLTGAIFFSYPQSILPTVMSIIGIIAGSIITLFMLEKKGIFPGLPFPIMLGLAAGLVTGFLV